MLTDRQIERLLQKYKPIGHLAEKHSEYRFAAVLEINGEHFVLPNRDLVRLPKGTKIKLWNREIIDSK
jgi:hypothetical protein